jgi:capsular polysaccharide biosynthesis protein
VTTTLAEYGRLLWSRWRWLMWGVLLALAAATAVLILSPPLYRSEATVFVRTPGDVSRVQDGGDSYAQARAGTYSALAESTSLAARVIADLGLDLKPETLSGRVQAIHDGGTALMNVAVSAPSGAEAQRTATVLLNELSTTVRSLESVPGALVPRAELVVVDPPSRPVRILAWGVPIWLVLPGVALLGLVLGAVGAVVRSLNEHPVSDEDHEEDTSATALMPSFASATSDVLVGSDGTIDAAPIAPGRARHRAARQMLTNGNEGDA